MLGHSCVALHRVALLIRRSPCPASIKREGRAAQAAQEVGNICNVCISCLAHVCMFLCRIFWERNFNLHWVAFACSLTGLWAYGNVSTHFWMLFAGLCGIAAHGVDAYWRLNFWTLRLTQISLSAIWKNTSEFVWTSFSGRDIWENFISSYLNQKVEAASPFPHTLKAAKSHSNVDVYFVGGILRVCVKCYICLENRSNFPVR